ncbi:tRNase Z TRZ3, mitochondrial isoform X1 [Vicia villosa]|uniref:tRNase Z TRZ3, mitochondrial isoform X1 n=2 Tax=Vicia villosa TaxID=3911 RepID=UPI00273C9FBD|nr:tRNase Z TRZ3, mitochondrial isoform X1 [Vicia villosa]
MAQILNVRHFRFFPSLPLFYKPTPTHLRILSTFAASSSKRRRNANIPPLHLRSKTTLPMEVEETKSFGNPGFNKRRAEGTDKADFPKKNLQLKVRKLNPINTISYVQVLGTGMDTQDTSPAVMLFFDKQRFIFNAGEGLQRFCTEHRIKLSKIDHIFLSRVCSETAGGLPGLLLTLAGMGEEGMSVNIWGPSDLKYLVDAMRSFIPNAAMVHTKSFGPTFGTNESLAQYQSNPIVLVDDEVVRISAIILQPKGQNDTVDSSNVKKITAAKPGDMSVVYVCELPEIKGKFDLEKAKALGLRPGPKYRELQLGNSVKSDHQNVMVHPSDVMAPSIPGPIVLVVDCPTESHLEALLSAKSLATYGDQVGNLSKSVACVIHLTPEFVVSSSNYQKWMKTFGSAQHIMAGHEKKNIEVPILKASARIATRLNYLCPQFFPAPGFWSCSNENGSKPGFLASSEDSFSALSNVIHAENLLKFTLRPYVNLGLDRSCIPTKVSSSEIIDELLLEIPEVVEAAQHVSQLWQDSSQTTESLIPVSDHTMVEEPWLCEDGIPPACLENIRRDDLEIVLLGTGSSQPSKYRNVTSIYINLFSKGGLLLDCGEGSLGQLKRRYGVSGADDVVRSLICIWISHIHADHHTGLARILALRRDLLKGFPHEPVLVVGPRKLKRYLDAYQRLEDLDMLFLDCKHTTEASLDNFENDLQEKVNSEDLNNNSAKINASKLDSTLFAKGSRMQSYLKIPGSPVDKDAVYPLLKKLKGVIREAGLNSLISFPVVHCPQSYGVVLQAEERTNSIGKVIPGWKIVYSGDTRPCPELIEASRNATVLIHEATFEEGMVEEAIAKNHSTTNEAIEMGESANVYRIILTHFSQRYPKIPVFDKAHMDKTCVAFDMMSINIADLPVLPKVLPYLKLLFRNDMIVDESDDVVDVATSMS